LSVFRVIEGRERPHPNPKGPFPPPELYESERSGAKLARAGVEASGTVKENVPFAGLTWNFSPIPRMAPPPFGSETDGREAPWSVEAEPGSRDVVRAALEAPGGFGGAALSTGAPGSEECAERRDDRFEGQSDLLPSDIPRVARRWVAARERYRGGRSSRGACYRAPEIERKGKDVSLPLR
jgi:hypothetical protein